ncbi:AIPR family protein [Fulvivirga sp. 29W222]|uniref:AIPR family protein n=1 Tax=Fulvivirga marina TaxID=2494733 RepID=A0A937G067_9BACT|nr:AIPR family protein [Fulvivirga marina]MBL6447683.1 AIPR family protein [Fulvivirga marina]
MDRIIESFVEDFESDFNYKEKDRNKLFEHFSNYLIVSKLYPDKSSIDKINVGGAKNPGIDGLAVMTNNHLITSIEEVDYFIQENDLLEVDFNFVQSKTTSSFELSGISNFITSVREFFKDGNLCFEDELLNLRDLKNYIYKNSIKMEKSPTIKLYYITTGKWIGDQNLLTTVKTGINDLMSTDLFCDVKFIPIDADKIKSLYREIKNKITREISFEKHTILPMIDKVSESYLGILPAGELIKITTDEDGEIIKTIFYDNVRDFQGFNKVNSGIRETINNTQSKDKFVLLNNGITIVAKSLNKVGSSFKISDFQIVNGCQTSHVLHHLKDLVDSNVKLPLKLIVTDDDDTINDIIKATNSQTEVKNEAFEILKPFHKRLEEFYDSFSKDEAKRLFYERRSKQYSGAKARQEKVISLSTQISSYVAMFLNEPQSTHRYFGELLKAYNNRLFLENHSLYPYYTSGLALSVIEEFYRDGNLSSSTKKFKFHLLLMLRIHVAGEKTPINVASNSKLENYCLKICDILWNRETALKNFKLLESKLKSTLDNTDLLKRQAHSMRAFTEELIPTVTENRKFGKVTYYNSTRGFGFIRIDGTDDDVFIHYTEVMKAFDGLTPYAKSFSFDVYESDRGPQAKNMELI